MGSGSSGALQSPGSLFSGMPFQICFILDMVTFPPATKLTFGWILFGKKKCTIYKLEVHPEADPEAFIQSILHYLFSVLSIPIQCFIWYALN